MIEERATQKWTLDEDHRLGQQGFFGPDKRVERINGEIVEMSPVGKRPKACVSRLSRWMVRPVQDPAVVIEVSDPTLYDQGVKVPMYATVDEVLG